MTLPSAGAVVLSQNRLLRRVIASGGPGVVNVPIRLTKTANRRLKAKGRIVLSAVVSFTPNGGQSALKTAKLKIKVKKKKKKK